MIIAFIKTESVLYTSDQGPTAHLTSSLQLDKLQVLMLLSLCLEEQPVTFVGTGSTQLKVFTLWHVTSLVCMPCPHGREH